MQAQAEERLAAMQKDKVRVREGNKRYVAEKNQQIAALSDSCAAYAARESRRQRAEFEAEQHKLREKERAERKEHLANLGKGILTLAKATEHSMSKDEQRRAPSRRDVHARREEYRALEDVLRPAKPRPAVDFAVTVNNLMRDRMMAFDFSIPRPLAGW